MPTEPVHLPVCLYQSVFATDSHAGSPTQWLWLVYPSFRQLQVDDCLTHDCEPSIVFERLIGSVAKFDAVRRRQCLDQKAFVDELVSENVANASSIDRRCHIEALMECAACILRAEQY